MKLELRNCTERYTVEQSLLNLFPGELPEYTSILPGDSSWAVVELQEKDAGETDDSGTGKPDGGNTVEPDSEHAGEPEADRNSGTLCRVSVTLSWHGLRAEHTCENCLTGTAYQREGARRRLLGRCFFLAAREVTGRVYPWGMLSGVRPDKLTTNAMERGMDEAAAAELLEQEYFVTPRRAALAAKTGHAAFRVLQTLAPRDIAVYAGIPFCPTRCAYCSFVSQSVEKSLSRIPPYVHALITELRRTGDLSQRLELRPRAFYMGGGTPTTLSPAQLHQVLSALETSFDWEASAEWTVEAGRPDTISGEKLDVLRDHGVRRISVNPQSMDDRVLEAIGRRHTAADTERAMELTLSRGFAHVNMDLIAGLPCDTPEGFAKTLERCLDWMPDNLTVHTLALKKGSRILTEGLAIPGGEAVSEMLDTAQAELERRGYVPYYLYRQKYMSGSFENIGWCKPGAECLYNICVMSELCTILSCGAGGSTKLVDAGRGRIQRLFNPKYAEEYLSGLPERQTVREAAVEAFYRNRET